MKHLLTLFCILALAAYAVDPTYSVPGRPSEIATAQVTLSTSSSLVLAGNKLRRSAVVRNNDASISIYVGVTGVTTSTGLLLKAGESISMFTTGPIYAVAASGTPVVSYLAEND